MNKHDYLHPTVKVVAFKTEAGFAASGPNLMNMESINGMTTFMNSWSGVSDGFTRNEQYNYQEDNEELWGW